MGDRVGIIITKEMRVRFAKEMKKLEEKGTPLPGNKCKKKGCNGSIVRRVSGYFRDRLTYGIPECNKCGRQYLYAGEGVPAVGEKEFIDLINQPYTI